MLVFQRAIRLTWQIRTWVIDSIHTVRSSGILMTHEAESAPVQPINRQLVLDSLTIPERIRIFRDCPDQFTPDPERAKVITAVWLSKLG